MCGQVINNLENQKWFVWRKKIEKILYFIAIFSWFFIFFEIIYELTFVGTLSSHLSKMEKMKKVNNKFVLSEQTEEEWRRSTEVTEVSNI